MQNVRVIVVFGYPKLETLTLFQLGSGVTLPTGDGPLWPASVLSVIKPLKDY